MAESVTKDKLVVAAVLSGNRNFEGRVNPLGARANYLASPPLVVAYALAGPHGSGSGYRAARPERRGRKRSTSKDVWPSQAEVDAVVQASVRSEMFQSQYAHVFDGDASWQGIQVPTGDLFAWGPDLHLHQAPALL